MKQLDEHVRTQDHAQDIAQDGPPRLLYTKFSTAFLKKIVQAGTTSP